MEISEGVRCRGCYIHSINVNQAYLNTFSGFETSSETQGHIVGVRESLNGKKYGTKKSKEMARRAPGDNVLPDEFQMVAAVVTSDLCQKTFVFFCPIRRQNGGDRLELVW